MQRMDGIIADLRRVRKAIEAGLAGAEGCAIAPSNDPAGDCGVVCAFQFENEDAGARLRDAPGVGGYVGIDHGKHVYTDWEPLRAKRISHHPDMNPFFFAKNQGLRMDYSDTACPRTLEFLRRTVFCSMNPDWTEADVAAKVASLCAAARA